MWETGSGGSKCQLSPSSPIGTLLTDEGCEAEDKAVALSYDAVAICSSRTTKTDCEAYAKTGWCSGGGDAGTVISSGAYAPSRVTLVAFAAAALLLSI